MSALAAVIAMSYLPGYFGDLRPVTPFWGLLYNGGTHELGMSREVFHQDQFIANGNAPEAACARHAMIDESRLGFPH